MSAFSMFVLAAFHLMSPTWNKENSKLYDQTLRDFLEVGAIPGDQINVESLFYHLRTCRVFHADRSLCDDIEGAQRIKAQLLSQQVKALESGRAGFGACISSVLAVISRFEERKDCARGERKAPSGHGMQAGEEWKRARLSNSPLPDIQVTNAKR